MAIPTWIVAVVAASGLVVGGAAAAGDAARRPPVVPASRTRGAPEGIRSAGGPSHGTIGSESELTPHADERVDLVPGREIVRCHEARDLLRVGGGGSTPRVTRHRTGVVPLVFAVHRGRNKVVLLEEPKVVVHKGDGQ